MLLIPKIVKYLTFEEDLSKLQAPLATTDITIAATATILCSRRRQGRKAAVAKETKEPVETMAE